MRAFFQSLWLLPRRLLLGAVQGYRYLLKPWLGNACRFEPTCSAYALQALREHGAVQGVMLSGWRILRCHPWCQGGCDPVPDNPPFRVLTGGLFTRLLQHPDRAATPPRPTSRKTP